MAGGAKLAEVTIQSLLAELEQARVAAQDDRQFSAAVQAIAGKARLTGLDSRESGGGSGGQFDRCETVEQVMAMLVAECGSAAQALADFDEVREMIEAYAASHATPVEAAEPARPRPDEAALALSYLRPRYRRR
ncbi:hypothetical protein [Bradyrhizobium sp. AZCC 2289]|uniref:hypothetical protein n=1 Tax=Bradyrhizobium sp. AZCC 2289 TaxID=3117026 RepID=UPI002FF23378